MNDDNMFERNGLGEGLVENYRQYIDEVMRVGKERSENFGAEFNFTDFVIGAVVPFAAGGVWENVPPSLMIPILTGRNPFGKDYDTIDRVEAECRYGEPFYPGDVIRQFNNAQSEEAFMVGENALVLILKFDEDYDLYEEV